MHNAFLPTASQLLYLTFSSHGSRNLHRRRRRSIYSISVEYSSKFDPQTFNTGSSSFRRPSLEDKSTYSAIASPPSPAQRSADKLPRTNYDSIRLPADTEAAVEMIIHGATMDFAVDAALGRDIIFSVQDFPIVTCHQVIVDMERFKQDYHKEVNESQHYLRLSKKLHQSLLSTKKRVMEHGMEERYRMIQEIFEIAGSARSARSIIHKKVLEYKSLPTQPSKLRKANTDGHTSTSLHHHDTIVETETSAATETSCSTDNAKQPVAGPYVAGTKLHLPKVGDMVNVPSLNKKATFLKLDPSKEEILVADGSLRLKLKLPDSQSPDGRLPR